MKHQLTEEQSCKDSGCINMGKEASQGRRRYTTHSLPTVTAYSPTLPRAGPRMVARSTRIMNHERRGFMQDICSWAVSPYFIVCSLKISWPLHPRRSHAMLIFGAMRKTPRTTARQACSCRDVNYDPGPFFSRRADTMKST